MTTHDFSQLFADLDTHVAALQNPDIPQENALASLVAVLQNLQTAGANLQQENQDLIAQNQQNTRLLQAIVQQMPSAIYLLDLTTHQATFLSKDAFLGYDVAELATPDSIRQMAHPDDGEQVTAFWQSALRLSASEIASSEYRLRHKDGTWRWLYNWVTLLEPLTDKDEKQLLVTLDDVTNRREAELRPTKSEQDDRARQQMSLQSAALAAAANGIIITDRDGTIEWVNPAFSELTGYAVEEAIGQNPRLLKSGKHSQAFYQELWDTILSGRVWHGRMINQHKDGHLYHEEETITPVRNEQGIVTHFIAIKQDITTRVQAEEQLQKWAHLFEHADWGVVTSGADGKILELMNPAFARMHGYTVEELTGRLMTDVFAPEYRDDVAKHMRIANEQGRHTFESWHIHKDGTTFPVLVDVTAVKDNDGNILYRAASVQDISQRVRSEIEIRQRNTQLSLINSLNHAANRGDSLPKIIKLLCQKAQSMFAARDASVYLLSNDKQYLVLQDIALPSGLTRRLERLIGINIPAVKIHLTEDSFYYNSLQSGQAVIINDTEAIRRMIAEHIEDKLRHDLAPQIARLLNYDSVMCIPLMSGEEPVGLLNIARKTPFDKANLMQLAALAEQLTAVIQRKRTEEALKKANRRSALILQAAGEGIFGLDADGNVIFINPAAENMLGWSAADLVGKSPHSCIHHTHADNTPFPAANCPIHTTIQDGSTRHVNDGIFWRKDGSSFPVEYISQPVRESGNLLGAVVTFKDISERQRQEIYLQSQQRLATVGQLAAGIAHDFNNIMAVISLYSDLAANRIAPTEKLHRYLTTIQEQAKHAADLIRQILDFSRQSVMERHAVDLFSFVKELLKLLTRTLPENIHLKLDYGEGQYLVNADLTRLQQILMNLVINARDAMPGGGRLHFTMNLLALSPDAAPPMPDMPPGQWVCLSVSDTGEGIPPQNVPHIFEPFFSTKTQDKGTGLGLAQAYGIIKQHDGFIGVSSQVGSGTTFTIYLPALDSLHETPPDAAPEPMATGQGETILIVEDEEKIRTAVCDLLTTFNYRPLPAANGEDALALFTRHENEIVLVLSDVMMPGMSGLTLHQKLTAVNPAIKTILMTGYPLEKSGKMQLERGIVAWLQKPVNMEKLLRLIAQTLETTNEG